MGTDLSARNDLVVFGALRSGSTMLRLMIDAHPAFQCNGEHDYLFQYVWFDEAQQQWLIDREKLLMNRIFRAHDLRCPQTSDAKTAIASLLTQLRNKSEGRLVVIIHRNLKVALALMENPPIVHLIRDPRDVAASSIGMGWAGNVYYGADHWIATENEWARALPILSGLTVFTLRFEDLVADPDSRLTELCNFAGVDFSPKMLEFHRVTTYSPVDSKLASQWRKKRTERELALIELRAGKLLTATGFKPSGVVPIRLNSFEKVKLWLENKSFKLRFRIKRHGLFDTIWVTGTRRLGLEALAKSAILRMSERDKRYLK